MIAPRLFTCSGAKVVSDDPLAAGRQLVELDSVGSGANVNIRFENVAKVFNKHLSPRLVDLLEIASYVFSADCATSRGSEWTDESSTEPWSRDFAFVIPVREPNFWNTTNHKCLITEVLSFLSNDKYSFTFVPLEHDRPDQQYLEFGELEDWLFYNPERVVMFSGGLDSLAGAVETARSGANVVLVSHRPVSTLDSRQRKLFAELQKEFPKNLMHIPVWINKAEKFGREPTQRTRSFLYSALGTVVAQSIRAGGVRFFENGVVSLNLPVADEAIRARASRTTHPIALQLFKSLYSAVTERDFAVDNPYRFRTKTDVVGTLSENKAAHLIPYTCSCAHSIFKSKTQWHCGTCSQCIDRRFAITAAGLLPYDPDADYVSDVFTGSRKDGQEKNMAVDYARHGIELYRLSESELASVFNAEISRAVRYEPKRSEAAEKIIQMHKRHGEVVTRVLQGKIAEQAVMVVAGTIDPSSLVALVIGGKHLEPIWERYCERIVNVLKKGLPVACSTHKPKDEPHLQELCDGIMKSNGHDLVREFPFMRWSSSLAKPDWYVESLNVVIEAKYVRKKEDLRPISEAIAADITKYGDNKFKILFVVYDPSHLIADDSAFAAPILARNSMLVDFIR
jgi:REase_DpnII-MboI